MLKLTIKISPTNAPFIKHICLIKGAFVGEKNFERYQMHDTTIKKFQYKYLRSTHCL
jgi:hypothetical protein